MVRSEIATVHILPHTNFTFFKTSSEDIDGCCSATRRAIELKFILEQRAYTPSNISKAQPKRLRNKKVILISPLSFFIAVHGMILHRHFTIFYESDPNYFFKLRNNYYSSWDISLIISRRFAPILPKKN